MPIALLKSALATAPVVGIEFRRTKADAAFLFAVQWLIRPPFKKTVSRKGLSTQNRTGKAKNMQSLTEVSAHFFTRLASDARSIEGAKTSKSCNFFRLQSENACRPKKRTQSDEHAGAPSLSRVSLKKPTDHQNFLVKNYFSDR